MILSHPLKLSFIACLLTISSSLASVSRKDVEEPILCRVMQVDTLYKNSVAGTNYDCIDDNDTAFTLDGLEGDDVQNTRNPVALVGIKDENNAKIALSQASMAELHQQQHHSRNLFRTVGTSRVLVVRVTYRGRSPSLSAAQLSGRVFGLGNQIVGTDFAQQYARCSFGKLLMKPFVAKDVRNGVAEMKITRSVSKDNVKVLQNVAYEAAKKRWNMNGVQHIMLVMPPGLLANGRNYLAYAYLGSKISVYNDKFAGQLSALIHEIGHNLNLHHSGQGNQEYGDQQGYLGYGVPTIGGPDMCFNPQKFYSLGWLEDRSLSLDLRDLPWGGNLAPFIQTDKTTEGQFVNIAVGGRIRRRVFMHYNLAQGFNDGSQEFRNKITLVSAVTEFGALKSTYEGSMTPNKNGVIRYNNFEGTGKALVVQGCRKVTQNSVTLVRISLHVDDGKQMDTCSDKLIMQPVACQDAKSNFFVNKNLGLKNCKWLAKRKQQWAKRLCKPNHLAYQYCRATCGKCLT